MCDAVKVSFRVVSAVFTVAKEYIDMFHGGNGLCDGRLAKSCSMFPIDPMTNIPSAVRTNNHRLLETILRLGAAIMMIVVLVVVVVAAVLRAVGAEVGQTDDKI